MARMFEYISNNQDKFLDALFTHIVYLVIIPVAIAILISVPLGILCSKKPKIGKLVMSAVSILQTIPSLALLAFMITLGFGIGLKPAIIALVLYSLLPITRNTYIGITGVDRNVIDAARGIGFDKKQIMFKIELPLAVPSILGGIRTATVTCVGMGVLAAYIGCNSLGSFVVTGLAQVRSYIILAGALPATILALVLDFILAKLEKWLTPKGLR